MHIVLIVSGIVLVAFGIKGLITERKSHSSELDKNSSTSLKIEVHEPMNVKEVEEEKSKSLSLQQNNSDQEQNTALQELNNKEKGNLFEGFVADCFNDKSIFTLLEWNQGTTSPTGVYAKSNENPDFHIQQIFSSNFKIDYYVEAKYLSYWSKDKTLKLNSYQLERYKNHQPQTHRKVLLAIGVGGKPDLPSQFYLVPVDSINSASPSQAELENFIVPNPRINIQKYIRDYFNQQVFKKRK